MPTFQSAQKIWENHILGLTRNLVVCCTSTFSVTYHHSSIGKIYMRPEEHEYISICRIYIRPEEHEFIGFKNDLCINDFYFSSNQ